jgi:hypothetical protein
MLHNTILTKCIQFESDPNYFLAADLCKDIHNNPVLDVNVPVLPPLTQPPNRCVKH